ncbi:MAG: flagellar filament capping protein FliD [Pseudohongiellaceae bacterium]|nr:flagellar filament capping protein FliD [Pseudohongiellaceae bacterium]
MASIQSLGIGSGLLTSDLVDQLIAAEREPVELRLDSKQALTEAKITAFGEITSVLSSFDSAVQALTLPSSFNASTATSSNESALTATASSVATAGSYTVSVSQLAQNHAIASQAYEETSDVVGTGTLTFRFGTTTFNGEAYDSFDVNADVSSRTISIDSTNNTLSGIRDAINAEDFGVQASIVDDGSGYRLVFKSEDSGAENSIEVVASGTDGLKALNFNATANNLSLNAVAETGSLDLSTGGGLDTADLAFSFSYNDVDMDVVVSSDPAIDTTAEALAAIQSAIDTQLAANGFAAGDVIAGDDGDALQLSTLETGYGTTLEVLSDGTAAELTGSTTLSAGFDFAANNATFSISIDGGGAQAITLDTATASAQETVDLINQKFVNAGIDSDVEASLDGSGALVFTRLSNGASATLDISAVDAVGTGASAELGLSADTAAGLDGFGLNAAEGEVFGSVRLTQTIEAADAQFSVNGLDITRSSNLVTGVITGTTLNLRSTTDSPTTLTIEKDPSSISERLETFVSEYNNVKVLTNTLTEFDPDAGENGEGSLLIGDSTIRRAMSDINSLLRSAVTGLTGDVRTLSDIGISTDQNNGYTLTFDASTFAEKFETNSADILSLFATSGSTTDSQITYTSATSATQAGTYDVEITRLATTGTYTGRSIAALGAGNIVIDSDNNEFTVTVNGVTANISLEQGTYDTADDLAEQIQLQINSDSNVVGGSNSVTVSFDSDNNRFDFESNKYGSASEILFTSVDSTVADTLGLVTDTQGDFFGNSLAGLATPNGLSSENFNTAVTIDLETSFKIAINGVSTDLLTVPGDSGSPQVYNTPDELIAAVEGLISADPEFAAQEAQTTVGAVLTAGQDFSSENKALSISLDGGDTATEIIITGDASTVSFNSETPGTIENTLAAVQDAIDATALNGLVVAALDDDNQIYFQTVATGDAAEIQVTQNGSAAEFVGGVALSATGYDFSVDNATFDLTIDDGSPVSITIDQATTDASDMLAKVQDALLAAGIDDSVEASLDGSDQLVFTYLGDTGTDTQIEISNVVGSAATELGLSNTTVNGLGGLGIGGANGTGRDAITVSMDYVYDADTELGQFTFSTGSNDDEISFSSISTGAGNRLGLVVGTNPADSSVAGLDVEGTINGVEATGVGQSLTGVAGNVEALPGFYLNAAHGNLAASTVTDTFKVIVDGVSSDDITLGNISNTSSEAVASVMQTAINNSPSLLAAGVSVTVEYDTQTGGFGIISNTTGSSSSVSLTDIAGNAGVIFGFNSGIGAYGKGGSNSSGDADPAAGLKIKVTGGSTGERGSVSYINGIANQLSALFDDFLGNSGLFAAKTNALNDDLSTIADDRAALDARIARSEERLRSSFLTNDILINQLNTTRDFLTSQLEMLEALASNTVKSDK